MESADHYPTYNLEPIDYANESNTAEHLPTQSTIDQALLTQAPAHPVEDDVQIEARPMQIIVDDQPQTYYPPRTRGPKGSIMDNKISTAYSHIAHLRRWM